MYPGQYTDYERVFVTTANVSESLLDVARQEDIKVLDGAALVEWIAERFDALSSETKWALGIYAVPRIFCSRPALQG